MTRLRFCHFQVKVAVGYQAVAAHRGEAVEEGAGCKAEGLGACLACSWVMQCVLCVLRRLLPAACSGARLPMRPC